ncbi:hypothetical protein [Tsukamurella sp. PLM1]|uniref:hypothetical protein n=1 Tax=Tsukamurella sp. PLM1 TaxID=2929795 RepID=UPI0020BF863D|nr:hypothetical protein [Tsukamurella sp. PLM1]
MTALPSPPGDDPDLIRDLLAASAAVGSGVSPEVALAELHGAGWDVECDSLLAGLTPTDAMELARNLVADRARTDLARLSLTREERICAVRRASPADELYREADAA